MVAACEKKITKDNFLLRARSRSVMLSMANIQGTGDGMERSITRGELEAALVRSCAPVLLGVKPANLFTFCGCFGCGGADGDASSCPSPVAPPDDARCARRRDALLRLVRDLDATLASHGLRCRVIAWRRTIRGRCWTCRRSSRRLPAWASEPFLLLAKFPAE